MNNIETENLVVPKSKCPRKFLAEMKKRIDNAWIIVDASIIVELLKSKDSTLYKRANFWEINWKEIDEHSKRRICYNPIRRICYNPIVFTRYYQIISIEDEGICYIIKDNPEHIFLIRNG